MEHAVLVDKIVFLVTMVHFVKVVYNNFTPMKMGGAKDAFNLARSAVKKETVRNVFPNTISIRQ